MKALVIVTAFPLREGEDPQQLATVAGDAAIAAIGGRDGEGRQVAVELHSAADLKKRAMRAARAAAQ